MKYKANTKGIQRIFRRNTMTVQRKYKRKRRKKMRRDTEEIQIYAEEIQRKCRRKYKNTE